MRNFHETPSAPPHPKTRARWRRAAVAVLLSSHAWPPAAQGHPFGDRFAAHRLEVDVGPDAVDVTLTSDVPHALLEAAAPGADDPARTILERLDHGVSLAVDGRAVPLQRVEGDAGMDLVDGHAWILRVRWRGVVDLTGRHRLRVSNGNLTEAPSFLRGEVRLPPASVLHGTNLVRTRRGREEPLYDAWLRHEGLRRLDLDLELRADPWSRAFRAVSPEPWSLERARRRTLPEAWREGRTDPGTVLLAGGVAALAGLGAGALGGRGGRLPAALLLLGLLPLALPPGPAALLLGVAALLAALDAAFARFAPLLAAPWCALALGPPWGAAAALVFLLAGSVGARALRPEVGVGALLTAAVLAAARGAP